MPTENSSPSFSGREEDFRPSPGTGEQPMIVEAKPAPSPVHEISSHRKRAKPGTDWPQGHVTGAFVSRAASIRHEVKPYRWWRTGLSLAVLYGAFIGLPAAGLVWAVIKIMREVHSG